MSETCEAIGCDRKSRTPGSRWCGMHYTRWRKHGRVDTEPRNRWVGKTCTVEECPNPAKSKGYCGKHYERVRRYGDPSVQVLIYDDPERRFWSYVNKTETCWLWTGTLTWDGYGLFGVKGKRTGAHRWAYTFTVGTVPAGLQLDHLCRVRKCVNPQHLEPVTPAENTRRAIASRQEEVSQ